jgi:nitrogen fixation protein FixH
MVSGLVAMAVIASGDPAFAIEPDYYAKAVRWDDERAQQAVNAELGWQLEASLAAADRARQPTPLVVRIIDRAGRPVARAKLTLEAFANARAAELVKAELEEQADGTYAAALPLRRAGLWELRFIARRDGERFTHTVRLELPRGGS